MVDARSSGVIVVDRWPLMRIGMAKAVHKAGLQVAGEAPDLAEGTALGSRTSAGVLLVGDLDAVTPAGLRRAAGAATVMVLVGQATRAQLLDLLAAGVCGIGLRSSSAEDVADLLRRCLAGERALAPALVSVLVDRNATVAVPRPEDVPVSRAAGELTAKERRVLVALAAGSSNSEIAAELYVSPATVKTHLAHIYAKLQVGGRTEALSRAVALGLVH